MYPPPPTRCPAWRGAPDRCSPAAFPRAPKPRGLGGALARHVLTSTFRESLAQEEASLRRIHHSQGGGVISEGRAWSSFAWTRVGVRPTTRGQEAKATQ